MSHLSVVPDFDRAFVERLVGEYDTVMRSCLGSPSMTAEELNAGPWYLEGEFGNAMDSENSRDLASTIWGELALGDILAGWTSEHERIAVADSISRIAFSGMYCGRLFAGSVVDGQIAGNAEAII